jgi:predicted membrane-bound mannosyltransferase
MDADSELVYLSQPPSQIHPTLSAVETAIDGHEGTDVVYFGDAYAIPDESIADRPPAHSGWHARLPLPWYFEAMNASVGSTTNRSVVLAERPPVIVTDTDSKTELTLWTSGYVVVERDTSRLGKDAVFLIRADRLPPDSPVADNPTTARHGDGVGRLS